MLVTDASAIALWLMSRGAPGRAAREQLDAEHLWVAPSHGVLEVLRTIWRAEFTGQISAAEAEELRSLLSRLPVHWVPNDVPMMDQVWTLRHNVSIYDAPYVALALRAQAPLITADARLGHAAEALGVDVRLIPLGQE